MTRKEKIERFYELCGSIGNTLSDCHKCPDFVSELCDKKSTTDFTDEELDAALDELEKMIRGMNDFDAVSRPAHYTKTSIECIDAMMETQGDEAVKHYCECNAFKYLWRHNSKNGDEDIRKASWYLNKAVEIIDKKEEEIREKFCPSPTVENFIKVLNKTKHEYIVKTNDEEGGST